MTHYGCRDTPPLEIGLMLWVQDGWVQYTGKDHVTFRVPKMVQIPFANSIPCGYDRAHVDSRCAGCTKTRPVDANIVVT